MQNYNHVARGLGYSYIITLLAVLVYNGVLTFTEVSSDTILVATAIITTVSVAIGAIYATMKISEKGLLYGLLVGISYAIVLLLTVYLAQDNFIWDSNLVYRVLTLSVAGGLGGVIGVNFK